MLGLVLEGGGAKGAFQAGAVKALVENGYVFDGVMGTSIGSLNGVMIAQGDFDKAYHLWETITPSMILELDDDELNKYFQKQMDFKTYKYFISVAKNFIVNKGLSVDKILLLLKDSIDEDKLRNSKTDFGLVTVMMNDGDFIPMEVFKEEIPYGKVSEYIMASAYYPSFKNRPIGGKSYIDGGVYDNMPINPLIRRGYDHIIAIRTGSTMPHQKVVDKTVKIDYINPSEPLGDTLAFSHLLTEKNLNLGYYDAMRYVKGYYGRHFYVESEGEDAYYRFVQDIPKCVVEEAKEIFSLPEDTTDMEVFNVFLSRLSKYFSISTECSNLERLVIGMEYFAKKYKIEKFHVYKFSEFVDAIIEKHDPEAERKSDFKKLLDKLFDRKIEYIFNKFLDVKALELRQKKDEQQS